MLLSETNRQRGLIALVEVLGLSVWFSTTAVVPSLRTQWGIGTTTAVWLTAAVQIGFVIGAVTSSLTRLADRYPPHTLLSACALGAAACTAALAAFADGLSTAIPLRLLTGIFLAGVYPVGMKLMASWSPPTDRGRAFGVLLGALTVGSALPHLLSGIGPLPWQLVLLAAAALTATAALVAHAAIRPGPHLGAQVPKVNPRHVIELFAQRGTRLVSLGYFGHMWELYAMWTWLSTFVVAGRAHRGDVSGLSTGVIVFVTIGVAGTAGCLMGGWASDRFGRSPAAVTALVISGACCIASPIFFAAPTAVLVAFLVVWGAAVIADSGVFSASLTETTDTRFIGTALTTQTAIGFLLTVVTIHLVAVVADQIGWQYAFLLLAPGPLLGAVAIAALPVRQHRQPPKEHNRDRASRQDNTFRRSDRGALPHRR